jgi:hypothetical protein
MTTLKAKLWRTVALLAATLVCGTSASASIVYDNSATSLERYYPLANNVPVGDEIFLAGTDRIVTDFRFELYLSPAASGDESLTLFFHQNDGLPPGDSPRKAPGTVLYQSDPVSLQLGYQTIVASGMNVGVPDNFTWSVVVNGLQAGEEAGLVLYSPPTVGSSYIDLWQQTGGSWELLLIDNATCAARVTAVPEPGTYALAALGLAIVGFARFRRRSA